MASLPLSLFSRLRAPVLRMGAPQLSVFRRSYSTSPYAELKGFPKEAAPEITLESLSAVPFGQEIREKLGAPINNQDIEVKPDGQIYLPEIKYRRVLNDAIGAGAWVLVPRGPPVVTSKLVTREYSLYCFGKFVSQATGEQALFGSSMTEATAIEATKSNALMRCCKDLGVASDLWDPNFILRWKSEFAQTVWCEHSKTKEKKLFHRKLNRPAFEYPWKETGLGPKTATIEFTDLDDDLSDDLDVSSSSSSSSSSSERAEKGEKGEKVPAAAARAAYKRAEASAAVPFSPQAQVPPLLKKFAGSTWEQMFQSKDGPGYVTWVLNNFKTNDPQFIKLVETAAEYFRDNPPDRPSA